MESLFYVVCLLIFYLLVKPLNINITIIIRCVTIVMFLFVLMLFLPPSCWLDVFFSGFSVALLLCFGVFSVVFVLIYCYGLKLGK